jgi:phosphohistidine phosphatase SixA
MRKLLLAMVLAQIASVFPLASAVDTTFYFIRHAEKVEDGSRDPALTRVGEERAKSIADLLVGNSVSHIFSTPYRRTMDTAKPIAFSQGLSITEYNPADLTGFAEQLKTLSGTIVVVGHSNTTPGMVNLITGGSLEDLDERVYDRIFVVTILESGEVELEVIHTQPRTPI